jgi:tetrahydromethanopterin S-methyltransferase subunit B
MIADCVWIGFIIGTIFGALLAMFCGVRFTK